MLSHAIVLVAGDGGFEARVSADILCAASPVWSERLALAPPRVDVTRSVETGTTEFEIDAFVGCLTLFTPAPTMPSLIRRSENRRGTSAAQLDIRRLTAALTLVHKYECDGLRQLIAHLADWHFPKCSLTTHRTCSQHPPGEQTLPVSRWISQEHLEYIMRCSELFSECDELLNETCLELLAQALSSPCGVQWSMCTRFANGSHFKHGHLAATDARDVSSDMAIKSNDAKERLEPNSVYRQTYHSSSCSLHLFCTPIVLVRGRLAANTLLRLFPYLQARNRLHLVTHDTRGSSMGSSGERVEEPEEGEVPMNFVDRSM